MYSTPMIVATSLLVALAAASPAKKHTSKTRTATASTTCNSGPAAIYVAGTQETTAPSKPYPTPYDSIMPAIASSAIPGVIATSLPYPDTGLAPGQQYYIPSWHDGVQALQSEISNYLDSCPKGSVVLLGYSQGAAVISAALGGFSASGASGIAPLDSQYSSAIVGGVLFADTSFVVGLSPLDYAANGVSGGLNPNNYANGSIPNGDGSAQALFNTNYGNRFRSYCEANDIYCASGNSGEIHAEEETYWESTAIAFLQSLDL